MGARRIFSRGGQIKGSGGRRFQAGFRGGTPVRVWDEAPRSWRYVLKMMHKCFGYWDLRQPVQHKNTLQYFHFQGRASTPFSMPAGSHAYSQTAHKQNASGGWNTKQSETMRIAMTQCHIRRRHITAFILHLEHQSLGTLSLSVNCNKIDRDASI